jgi:hypothetical protein
MVVVYRKKEKEKKRKKKKKKEKEKEKSIKNIFFYGFYIILSGSFGFMRVILPINIINDILQMAAKLNGTIWYYHVLENGEAVYRYNMKHKRIQKIEHLYSFKQTYPVSIQKLILKNVHSNVEEQSKQLYYGRSRVIGDFEDKLYVYKSFESMNSSKETIYLFLIYSKEHSYYIGNHKNIERGVLYKQGKETNIITYTLLNYLKIKGVYHYNLGLCFYD